MVFLLQLRNRAHRAPRAEDERWGGCNAVEREIPLTTAVSEDSSAKTSPGGGIQLEPCSEAFLSTPKRAPLGQPSLSGWLSSMLISPYPLKASIIQTHRSSPQNNTFPTSDPPLCLRGERGAETWPAPWHCPAKAAARGLSPAHPVLCLLLVYVGGFLGGGWC